MQGQDGGVIDDRTVLGMVNNIHRNELGAEGHDVELRPHRLVCVHHLREGLTLVPPAWKLEQRCPIFLCSHR